MYPQNDEGRRYGSFYGGAASRQNHYETNNNSNHHHHHSKKYDDRYSRASPSSRDQLDIPYQKNPFYYPDEYDSSSPSTSLSRPAPQNNKSTTSSSPILKSSSPSSPSANLIPPPKNQFLNQDPYADSGLSKYQVGYSHAKSMRMSEVRVRCRECNEELTVLDTQSHVCSVKSSSSKGNNGYSLQNLPPMPPIPSTYTTSNPTTTSTTTATPLPGSTVAVIKAYDAVLNDEIHLEMGDKVEIEECFDDGWAVGYNNTTGQWGAFPINCVSKASDKKTRTKSLYAGARRSTFYKY